MFKRKSHTDKIITGMVLGGLTGSILTLIFTPKSGKEVRDDIKDTYDTTIDKAREIKANLIDETRDLTQNLLSKAQELYSMAKDYAAGVYEGSAESFMYEYNRLRRAITTGLDTYRNYDMPDTERNEDIAEEIMAGGFENESLPKTEGMGRRQTLK